MIIGNFSTNNPTKKAMEIMGDWHLNHRSIYDLLKIANDAGINNQNVYIDEEPLGINLFMRIKL
jgi:hypothetical protein